MNKTVLRFPIHNLQNIGTLCNEFPKLSVIQVKIFENIQPIFAKQHLKATSTSHIHLLKL